MSLQTKYTLLKSFTILMSAVSLPWGTYTGYMLGSGNIHAGLISLGLQTVITFIDAWVWLRVLEMMHE